VHSLYSWDIIHLAWVAMLGIKCLEVLGLAYGLYIRPSCPPDGIARLPQNNLWALMLV
jgi:hypothetical protein